MKMLEASVMNFKTLYMPFSFKNIKGDYFTDVNKQQEWRQRDGVT